MGRETLRQRERRAAHFRVRHEGLADRAPVDAATVQRCLRGLDKHNCNHFGVRACVRMELDGLHEPPSHAWCGGTRCLLPWPAVGKRTTFIAYAAWRRRDPAVKQLIVGGADPTVSEAAAEGCAPAGLRQALHSVAPRSAVYAVAQIACDACGARPGEDGGAAARCGPLLRCAPPLLRCAPCGCVCCERCLWSTFCEPPQSQSEERGEVRCGACRASLHTPGGEEAEEGAALAGHCRAASRASCAASAFKEEAEAAAEAADQEADQEGGGADLDSDGSERGGDAALRAAWCPARALQTAVPLPTVCGAGLRVLISSREGHAGAGSVVIDGAVPEPLLEKLDALFASLPLAPRYKCTQGLNDRAYFCDAEGWGVPIVGTPIAHMRFLLYAEAGGGLPPHVDLSRTDATGRTSTHTFILYLSGCAEGGETVLLESLSLGKGSVRAAVTPVRGRLLLFPHACPHLARPVVAEGLPKLLLRGEMY
ncbi:putative transketolase [Emiliania huxleyi CCMP1516]|uniref:Fe2OG dioxygenase domain-containing protein n=2 Tax=Emiliania huxleyi TaxID=2903 RepID=A0A0D3JUJ3_EMIH1|nr:putative transketolase [Emiliania huxleyi CCMP1516]EOD27178.1 putative transketolase [Emiliania huxleyi CCMP1516]|eukprot:XP_005779607.1 putative transketolase [Emiliania huxleyi CCMP1516]